MPVPLIGPDGREYEIDDGDAAGLQSVLGRGFRVATQAPQTLGDKAKALGNEALDTLEAGASGAASGLSAGLTDIGLGKLRRGDELPHEKQAREDFIASQQRLKEAHPAAHAAGEIGGAILSPINKIGLAVKGGIGATTALGRIGAEAAAGATVGSLYGAGNTLSEASLGDHDLTAEQLVAGTGLGALLGGAGGGIAGAIGEGAAAVAPRLAKGVEGAQSELGEWANNRALKAAGATKRDLDYLGEAGAHEVGQTMLERGHLGEGLEAPNAAKILETVQADKEAIGARIGKVFDDAHTAGAQPNYTGVAERLQEFESKLSPLERKAIAPKLQDVRDAVAEYESNGSGFKAFNKLKQDLQAQAKWGDNVGQEFTGGLKRQLAGIVREELDTQLGAHLGPDAANEFFKTKKLYGLLSDAERVAEHGAERLGGNASFGLRDFILGSAAGAGHGNPVTGIVSAIANKVMREHGQAVVARLADAVAKSPKLAAVAKSFGTQMQTVALPSLGRYAAPLTQALQLSPANALATHMVMAEADPHYAEQAKMAGFLPETPEEMGAASAKAEAFTGIHQRVAEQGAQINRDVKKVLKGEKAPAPSRAFSGQDFGAKRMRRSDEAAHQKRAEEIRTLAADPQAIVDRVAANMGRLGEMTPALAGAATRTAHAAVTYLAAQIQEPPKAGPLAADWTPTDAERHDFASVLETVESPLSVLKHAAAGTLTQKQMDALRAVYPRLAQQVENEALMQLADASESTPYSARLMLGLLTNTDPDGSIGLTASNQAAIHAASKKPSNAGSPEGPKTELSLASRMAMPGQKKQLEGA